MKPQPYERACQWCGGEHATKDAFLRCTGDRRKSFAQLDADLAKALSKTTKPKEPKHGQH